MRSQIPSADSRLQRYVDIIKEKKIPYLITAWNRENKKKNEKENTILYNKRAPIGGGVSNIFSLILWNLFLFRILWENRKNYIIIHSIDFDTCIPAYIIAKIFKKKFIFDVYDKYTDARNTPSFVAFFAKSFANSIPASSTSLDPTIAIPIFPANVISPA